MADNSSMSPEKDNEVEENERETEKRSFKPSYSQSLKWIPLSSTLSQRFCDEFDQVSKSLSQRSEGAPALERKEMAVDSSLITLQN